MIKILIVDDVLILCQGLRAILSQDNEFEIVGMAHNGKEAYDLCKETLPDVVLMDMRMPEYDGVYGIKKIKQDFPQTKLLVLTTFDDEDTICKCQYKNVGFLENKSVGFPTSLFSIF